MNTRKLRYKFERDIDEHGQTIWEIYRGCDPIAVATDPLEAQKIVDALNKISYNLS